MSRHLQVAGRTVALCRSTVPAQYWVRITPSGRTLGCVFRDRSQWCWATTRNAYRGDGRSESATDGILDDVPAHLDALGKQATQLAACERLLTHLEATKAPALGYPPHPDVIRKVAV